MKPNEQHTSLDQDITLRILLIIVINDIINIGNTAKRRRTGCSATGAVLAVAEEAVQGGQGTRLERGMLASQRRLGVG